MKENMKAPVSVCLIVKNEENQLENCIKSFKDYVEEIIIIDTGSTDNTPEIAKKYAHKFEIKTDWNDENGFLKSFSDARQYSFQLASKSWVLWVDGDDEIIGAENLCDIINYYNIIKNDNYAYIAFPYEYAHDENGNCILIHYRERLIYTKENFDWINPVHEVLKPKNSLKTIADTCDKIKFIHHRQNKISDKYRNLRILERYYDEIGEKDPRQLYYLGLEYGNVGEIDLSKKFLLRYLELSGWEDEKYMACLKLADYYLFEKNYEKTIEIAFKAIGMKEQWFEAYFILTKCFYFIAQSGKDSLRNWQRCVHFAKYGLSLPKTQTLLFVNPLERNFEIHRYLNVALNNIGDMIGALESVNIALKIYPNDSNLLLNKKLYEKYIANVQIDNGLSFLVVNNYLNNDSKEYIISVLKNDLVPIKLNNNFINNNKLNKIVDGEEICIIPKNIDINAGPIDFSNDQALSIVKILWKHLIKHDEILNAKSLLDCVPWEIKKHKDIEEILNKTSLMLSHLNNDNNYNEHYKQYGCRKNSILEESLPLPKPVDSNITQYPRFKYVQDIVLKLLESNDSVSLLDIGSFDGWLTNRIGLIERTQIYGIDLCKDAVILANNKAKEFNTSALHETVNIDNELPEHFPKQYDVVSLLEIYEHVKDTKALVKNAYKYVKPGGILIISCPYGSWGQGQEICNQKWNRLEPREHVRAPTLDDLTNDMMSVGLVNIFGTKIDIESPEISGQASLCIHGYKPSNTISHIKKLYNIGFYIGPSVENWNPETAQTGGIGGSETAVIEMSKRLSKAGHNVVVYGSCSNNLEGIFDGVKYIDYSKFNDINCDILISSRRPEAFDYNINSKLNLCWIHDIHCGDLLNFDRSMKIDKFLCLSDWHKNYFLSYYYWLDPSCIIKTKNGIDLSRFDVKIERNNHRAIYSSSPDRGLQVLLQVWPKIREQVPDAELHVFYGFKTWEACASDDQKQLIYFIKDLLLENIKNGVTFHGRVNQSNLAVEYLKSNIWAYPTWFAETSCISAMEAHAAGLHMITSPIAALNETVNNRGILINGDWLSKEYQDRFVDEVVKTMKNPMNNEKRALLQNYAQNNFNWDVVCSEWEKMFNDLIEEKNNNIIKPYHGIVNRESNKF